MSLSSWACTHAALPTIPSSARYQSPPLRQQGASLSGDNSYRLDRLAKVQTQRFKNLPHVSRTFCVFLTVSFVPWQMLIKNEKGFSKFSSSKYMSLKKVKPLAIAGLGTMVGHETTHGFDVKGADYNEAGDLENCWTDSIAISSLYLLPLSPPPGQSIFLLTSLLGLIQLRHPLVEPLRTLFKGLLVQRNTNEVQNLCNSLVFLCARPGSGSTPQTQGVYTEETYQQGSNLGLVDWVSRHLCAPHLQIVLNGPHTLVAAAALAMVATEAAAGCLTSEKG